MNSQLRPPAENEHDGDGFSFRLSPKAAERFKAIKSLSPYPKGALLFVQGQPPLGVFFLRAGKVKVKIQQPGGGSVILRVAGSGDVLGLSSVVSGTPYDAIAEVADPSEIDFVPREHFLKFLDEEREACMLVVEQLARDCHLAYEQIRNVGTSASTAVRLSRLLLDSADRDGGARWELTVQLPLTHQEIASLIGTSRETVTRLLNDLERKGLIERDGSKVTIRNKARLQALSKSRAR